MLCWCEVFQALINSLYLLACQVRVIAGDSGLLTPFCIDSDSDVAVTLGPSKKSHSGSLVEKLLWFLCRKASSEAPFYPSSRYRHAWPRFLVNKDDSDDSFLSIKMTQ